jgi:hypothetical protein
MTELLLEIEEGVEKKGEMREYWLELEEEVDEDDEEELMLFSRGCGWRRPIDGGDKPNGLKLKCHKMEDDYRQ